MPCEDRPFTALWPLPKKIRCHDRRACQLQHCMSDLAAQKKQAGSASGVRSLFDFTSNQFSSEDCHPQSSLRDIYFASSFAPWFTCCTFLSASRRNKAISTANGTIRRTSSNTSTGHVILKSRLQVVRCSESSIVAMTAKVDDTRVPNSKAFRKASS